ncbi:hypothetical protein [Flaviaesturariibacter aridisoli]|uniref:Carboxypeptidase regulatory-like domain-containing protein n=1 Tax=Flaviaesturariibacter aridisoli TaxID=2545761 RepID=A0A4V2WMI5_9BACT|nr:hypothetical protein [Flaviaesturariibacter aridisoli]TCZ69662.1 hypothetical protein E0486_12115 [Flaviaesturariibacter aridisoli]
MLRFSFHLLVACFSPSAFAQLPLRVVDSASGAPLPYATVLCAEARWLRFADSLGRMTVPDSLQGKVFTLTFAGHYPKVLPLTGGGDVALAALPPLSPVLVQSCAATQPLTIGTAAAGELERKIRLRGGIDVDDQDLRWTGPVDGAQMAHWIENPTGKAGWMRSLTFGVHPYFHNKKYLGHANTPVRLRFFARGADGMPGEELGRNDIVVAAAGFGAFPVALEAQRIPLPPEGVFVAFELFDAGPDYWWPVSLPPDASPQAVPEVYGFAFAAHAGGSMYFRNPWMAWTRRSGPACREIALRIEARVCR